MHDNVRVCETHARAHTHANVNAKMHFYARMHDMARRGLSSKSNSVAVTGNSWPRGGRENMVKEVGFSWIAFFLSFVCSENAIPTISNGYTQVASAPCLSL